MDEKMLENLAKPRGEQRRVTTWRIWRPRGGNEEEEEEAMDNHGKEDEEGSHRRGIGASEEGRRRW